MSRTKKAFSGTVTSFVQYGIQILLQFLLAPLILKYAGQETMGAYAIVMQIIGYFSLADLGMNVSGNRYLAQSYNLNDNNNKYSKILGFLRLFSVGSSIFVGVAILVGLPFIDSVITLSRSVEDDFKNALLYYALWIFARGFIWFYSSGLIASQDLANFNKINIVNVVIKLVGSFIFVRFGFAISGLIFAIIISEVITGIMYFLRHKKLYPRINLDWKIHDVPLFKEVFKFGLNFFLINLASRLVLYSDNLIVGYLYGAVASSVFYLTMMPATLLNNIVMRISDSATPAINELYSKNQIQTLKSAYFKLHRITFVLISGSSIAYIFFAKSLISLWVGSAQYAGFGVVIFLSAFGFILTMTHIDNAIVIAKGKVNNLVKFALFEGFLKVLLSFILGKYLGMYGIIMATLIANIPTSLYIFITSFRILQTNLREYYNEVISKVLLPIITLTILSIVFFQIEEHSYLILISSGLVIFLIYSIMLWFISVDNTEKKLIKDSLASVMLHQKQKLLKNG